VLKEGGRYLGLFIDMEGLGSRDSEHQTQSRRHIGGMSNYIQYSSSSSNEEASTLPEWMFDIEDDEDLEVLNHLSLLQELEINPQQIIDCVVWQFKCPFYGLFRRVSCLPSLDGSRFATARWVHSVCHRTIDYNAHPIKLSSTYRYEGRRTTATLPTDADVGNDDSNASSSNSNSHVEFWGPMGVVTGFAALLWLGNQKNVPYVYVVWVLGALLLHLTVRPFLDGSSMSFHMAMLGYSLCPQLPLCFIVLVFRPSVFVCTLLHMIGVLWSSTAALMGYQMIVRPLIAKTEERSKLLLLVPMVFLFQVYMITLVPMRRWQINGGQPVNFL